MLPFCCFISFCYSFILLYTCVIGTYGNSYDLSCGACGYRETIEQADTYNAYCLNAEGLDFMRMFEVKRHWTVEDGYEIHQC